MENTVYQSMMSLIMTIITGRCTGSQGVLEERIVTLTGRLLQLVGRKEGQRRGTEQHVQSHEAQTGMGLGGKCKSLLEHKVAWKVRLRSDKKVLR